MASRGSNKTSSSNRRNTSTRNANTRRNQATKYTDQVASEQESALIHEVGLILSFALALFLFLCNFHILGQVGEAISSVMFGLFGWLAYPVSLVAFFAFAFYSANEGSFAAIRKLIAGTVLFFMLGIMIEYINGCVLGMEQYDVVAIYLNSSVGPRGGGALAGSMAYLLYSLLDTVGAILVVLILCIICFVLLTERSFVDTVKKGSKRVAEYSKQDVQRRKEYATKHRAEVEEQRRIRAEEKQLLLEQQENERILRMDKKISGVTVNTTLQNKEEALSQSSKVRDDIHEIILTEESVDTVNTVEAVDTVEAVTSSDHDMAEIKIHRSMPEPPVSFMDELESTNTEIHRERPQARVTRQDTNLSQADAQIASEIQNQEKKAPKKYIFPPLSRLQKGQAVNGDSSKELKETARRLQQTLSTFGVKVTVTDISQGPAVTRYELQPEQGVKVSKIVSLADDIKLNLAATDIRIEAPIPGKAAVGIEVPNKENSSVSLRDLLETKEFRDFSSNLSFAVGKDIAGKVVVTDIGKMPHVLIAGATGSGKSVCINTIIMSIIYKAHPDDVKMIMIDPKVVELSVYNGIPHLLVPVVTDPKKAAAALHWGVAEMTARYQKFADFNVRDLKGYNQKVEGMLEQGDTNAPLKLPQIVIIVDELADLMMVAPGDVEEAICRLAQLARAAGIHLIIATQRPSVDVITGLIKANMPSRIAFSVSSGVDSRTILDMNGAEKLLGKGDMLFYPQGLSKPARIQGAFVSDKEVSDVVDFLKNQTIGNVYAEDVEEQMQKLGPIGGQASGSASAGSGSDLDEHFPDAGKFIIEKDKASIGMLQRLFKIGFNRAARIMDQLCEHGVVGEEEGTKPRKVLMSMEEFENLLEEL